MGRAWRGGGEDRGAPGGAACQACARAPVTAHLHQERSYCSTFASSVAAEWSLLVLVY